MIHRQSVFFICTTTVYLVRFIVCWSIKTSTKPAYSQADISGGDMALPLQGIKVLDLTRALAGPFCSMILGDLGADVIKVEPAPSGDMVRTWGPFASGISAYYLSCNRNKRGAAVDFRKPAALEVLRNIAISAAVVPENFKRPA
ncbi:MAG: CaiB/BaiF family protein [uncultured Caballeronia sp.]|nr:MAG: CaiB/BaiF family protein [uncultured Caballeronia sp.]